MRLDKGYTAGNHFNSKEINKNMGERLVMHLLMTYYDWNVFYVDYVGADLLAIDLKKEHSQRYAISVKMRDITRESQSVTSFNFNDYENLCAFANSVQKTYEPCVIPLLAYVILTKSGHLYILFINAHDFNDMRNEGIVKDAQAGGYSLNVGTEKVEELGITYIQRILQDDRVAYFDLEMNNIKIKPTFDYNKKHEYENKFLMKDNWRNELGKLGESFVSFLSNARGRHSFWVNSEGIDHMMVDANDSNKQYGVSVKSAIAKDSFRFEAKDVINLEKVARDWNITPEIAIIAIGKNRRNEIETMYCFWIDFEQLKQYGLDTYGQDFIRFGQSKGNNAYILNWGGENLDKIKCFAEQEESWIKFYEVKF